MIKNVTGIVIKQKVWGESDLLVSLLSEDGERLDLVVKGAGNGKSKRRSHIELMNQIKVTVYDSARHSYLQTVECQESYFHLKRDFERVFQVYVLLEVIEQSTLPENADPKLYELLEATLSHLNQKNVLSLGAEIGLVKWGEALGILPSFRTCGECHKSMETTARWNHDKQVLLCEECAHPQSEELPLKYRKALEFFKSASFHECSSLIFQDEEVVKLRELIPYLLRGHLERPLKSLTGF